MTQTACGHHRTTLDPKRSEPHHLLLHGRRRGRHPDRAADELLQRRAPRLRPTLLHRVVPRCEHQSSGAGLMLETGASIQPRPSVSTSPPCQLVEHGSRATSWSRRPYLRPRRAPHRPWRPRQQLADVQAAHRTGARGIGDREHAIQLRGYRNREPRPRAPSTRRSNTQPSATTSARASRPSSPAT